MGELGCSWPLTTDEKKVLQAAALVQSGRFSNFMNGSWESVDLEVNCVVYIRVVMTTSV